MWLIECFSKSIARPYFTKYFSLLYLALEIFCSYLTGYACSCYRRCSLFLLTVFLYFHQFIYCTIFVKLKVSNIVFGLIVSLLFTHHQAHLFMLAFQNILYALFRCTSCNDAHAYNYSSQSLYSYVDLLIIICTFWLNVVIVF